MRSLPWISERRTGSTQNGVRFVFCPQKARPDPIPFPHNFAFIGMTSLVKSVLPPHLLHADSMWSLPFFPQATHSILPRATGNRVERPHQRRTRDPELPCSREAECLCIRVLRDQILPRGMGRRTVAQGFGKALH